MVAAVIKGLTADREAERIAASYKRMKPSAEDCAVARQRCGSNPETLHSEAQFARFEREVREAKAAREGRCELGRIYA